MSEGLAGRFGRGLLWNYVGRIGEFGIRFLFVSLVAKRLGPGDFGVYSFAYSVFVGATLLGALGYEQALNSFVPAHQDDDASQSYLLRRILALRVLIFAVLIVAGALLAPLLVRWRGPVAAGVVWALPYLFSFNIANLLAYFWVGRLDMKFVSIVRVLTQAANFAAVWWLLDRGWGSQGVLLLMGGTASIAAVAYLIHSARFLRGPAPPLPMGRIHRFSLNVGAINGLNYLLGQQSDVALLGLLLRDAVQVGFYNLAGTLNMIAGTALLIGMEGVGLSAMAEMAARGTERVAAGWRAFMKATMLLSVPVLAFCALHADKLLAFYGAAYADAAPLLRATLAVTIVNRFLGGGTSSATLYAIHRERWPLGIRVATGALNIGLAVAMIPRWGAMGAVIATGIALNLTAIAEVVVTTRKTGAAYPFRFAVITALCTALAAAASYPLTGGGIWGIAAGVGVFLLVFLAVFALSRPLEAGDCTAFGRLSPRLAAWAQRFVRR